MSATKKLLSIALAVLLTAGWGGCGQVVKPPKVILTPVEIPMKMTDEIRALLADCPIEEKTEGDNSVFELRRVTEVRKLQQQGCNKDKAGLRKILDSGGQ